MTDRPSNNFGKRRLAPLPDPSPPVKRSRHVALLMVGTMAVGGVAYGLTPHDSCQPASPGMAGPASPQAAANCGPRGSSSSGSGGHGGNAWWARNGFYSGESTTSRPSSPGTSVPSGGEASRGGFGSFARAFAAHFSGGT